MPRMPIAVVSLLIAFQAGWCPPAWAAAVEKVLAEINQLPADQRQKRLEDGARKEGRLSWYSNANLDQMRHLADGFMKRYPEIKIEYWRGGGNRVTDRVLLEHRAGKLDADIVGMPFEAGLSIKNAGVWARYHSPESKYYSKMFFDPEGYWHSSHLAISVIGYNTNLVRMEEAPKDYPDLLSPKWKSEISIDTEPERVVMGWLIKWGEQKTRNFLKGVMQNGAIPRRGKTLQTQLLCGGEFKIALDLLAARVAQYRNDLRCPSALVFPNPTVGTVANLDGITTAAQRPHAAALFIDYILGADGSKILANTGRIVGRKGVKSRYEELSNLEEKNIPLLLIAPEAAQKLADATQQIVAEILIRRQF